jgi:hypothetical protein
VNLKGGIVVDEGIMRTDVLKRYVIAGQKVE